MTKSLLTLDQLSRAARYNFSMGLLSQSEMAILVAYWQSGHSLQVDGMYGPATKETLDLPTGVEISNQTTTRKTSRIFYVPDTFDMVVTLYGDPTLGVLPTWEKHNLIELHDLPGVPTHWAVRLNVMTQEIFREGLRRAKESCPGYRIQRVGSYNFRMRSSGSGKLSLHGYGAALDIDAETNKAVRFKLGTKPEYWSQHWKSVWPLGLPKEFVEAMESVGLVWGGRFSTYVDPMHFQAAGINA
jgi:hypothetical protein